MKYIDEYRDAELISLLKKEIRSETKREYTFMEVCGGHTMAIQKFGLPQLIPEQIELISGPGCPVCVTSKSFIDAAIKLALMEDTIVATYGDLMRVPGSDRNSLERARSTGADVRIVFSAMDALTLAERNQDKRVIFLAIGFETTAPNTAAMLIEAKKLEIQNLFVLSALKTMPFAMEAIVEKGSRIDGYICPGHVCTIAGSEIFDFIPNRYKIACVVSGFEPLDLMQSIYMLLKQVNMNSPQMEIQYKRAVKPEGNLKAKNLMERVFEPDDDWWRGFGVIENSGLKLNTNFISFDAQKAFKINIENTETEIEGCICGEILMGKKKPIDCKLFANKCAPHEPIGACMVSEEGSCHAFYKYNSHGR